MRCGPAAGLVARREPARRFPTAELVGTACSAMRISSRTLTEVSHASRRRTREPEISPDSVIDRRSHSLRTAEISVITLARHTVIDAAAGSARTAVRLVTVPPVRRIASGSLLVAPSSTAGSTARDEHPPASSHHRLRRPRLPARYHVSTGPTRFYHKHMSTGLSSHRPGVRRLPWRHHARLQQRLTLIFPKAFWTEPSSGASKPKAE